MLKVLFLSLFCSCYVASISITTSFVGFVATNRTYFPSQGPSDYALYSAAMLLSDGPSAPRCFISLSGDYLGTLDSWTSTVVYNWALTLPPSTKNLTVGMNASIAGGEVRMFQSSLLVFLGTWPAAFAGNMSGFVIDCDSAINLFDPNGVDMVNSTSLHRIQVSLSNASLRGYCFIVPRAVGSLSAFYGAIYPIASVSNSLVDSFLRGLRRYANSQALVIIDTSASSGTGQLILKSLTDNATPPTYLIDGFVVLSTFNFTGTPLSALSAGSMSAGGLTAGRSVVATDSFNAPTTIYRTDSWTNAVLLGWLQSLPANRDALRARLQVSLIDEITPVVSFVNGTVVLDLGLEISTHYNNGTMSGYLFDTSSTLALVDANGVNLVASPGLHSRTLCIRNSKSGYMLVTFGKAPYTYYGAVYYIKNYVSVLSFYLTDTASDVGLLFLVNYTSAGGGAISLRGTPLRMTPAPPTTTGSPPTELVTTFAPSTLIPTAAPLASSLPSPNSATVPTWGWVAVGLGVAGCLGIVTYAAKRQAFRKKDPARVKREHAKELGRFDGIVRSIRADLDKETEEQYRDADEI